MSIEDIITNCGVALNVSKSVFIEQLRTRSISVLSGIRESAFSKAISAGLANPKDILVGRKESAINPLNIKLSEDIWTIMHSIRNDTIIPRTLLRNGKRSKQEYEESLVIDSVDVCESNLASPCELSECLNQCVAPPTSSSVSNQFFSRELNTLRNEVLNLKKEFSSFEKTSSNITHNQELLLLKKEVACLSATLDNITTSRLTDQVITPHSIPSNTTIPSRVCHTSSVESITLTSWNCRGISLAIPCIRSLIEEGSDIIILSEHWLWPYELHTLDKIHPDYSAVAVTDKRLSVDSTLSKGCGGVAILWRKSLAVTPITLDSDRLCAIHLKGFPSISIIGVYLPSSNIPIEEYKEYLTQLENLVAEMQHDGKVVVLGDFNAHIHFDTLDNITGSDTRGREVANLLDRYNLYPVSLTELHHGPKYTFLSGPHSTVIDYIIADISLSSDIVKCWTSDSTPGNISDHLPQSLTLSIRSHHCPEKSSMLEKRFIDWTQKLDDEMIEQYSRGVQLCVSPSLNIDFHTCDDIDREITRVSKALVELSLTIFPLRSGKKKPFIRDSLLSSLCYQNRLARRCWIKCGHPRYGPKYESMLLSKRSLRSYLNKCRAKHERIRLQKKDQMFRCSDNRRFKRPRRTAFNGSRIRIDDQIFTDKEEVLCAWKDYFSELGRSILPSSPSLSHRAEDVKHLFHLSKLNEDSTLDWDVTVEEIQGMIKKLKKGKSPGPDGMVSEHILFGGGTLILWLKHMFNSIIRYESIPSCFKFGVTTPIHKGKGKDPLNRGSYRGITVTPVIAKLFEYILLERFKPVLQDSGHPCLYNQEGLSCEEAIFTTQEAIRTLLQEDGHAFLTLFDIEKAFDSVEHPVLLKCLFDAGLNGKGWRLMKSWYEGSSLCVKISGHLSSPVGIERGVRQGSVLSPLLFIVLMDGLGYQLASKKAGISIEGLFVGGGLHADDVRTVSNTKRGVEEQADIVKSYVESHGLKINEAKTEVIAFARDNLKFVEDEVTIHDVNVPFVSKGCCLGYWWHRSLLSVSAVEENISKARKAFFNCGCLGVFQGNLNPLTSRSIYLTCVIPVLLYGCENWILNDQLILDLECFQAWAGKKILGLTKHHSNTIVPIALDLPFIQAHILIRKLKFLYRLTSNDKEISLGKTLFSTLAVKDIYNISVISQCLYLEEYLGTNFTISYLEDVSSSNILSSRGKRFKVAATKPRLKLLLNIEELYPWMKLWDWALDHGVKGTKACQTILKFITTPLHSSICYICQKEVEETSSFPDHLLSDCSKFALSPFTISDLYNSIGTEELFTYSKILSLHL